jgi:hypothetical protein
LTGIEIKTSIIRNNEEIYFITNDKFYDSEFQKIRYLNEPVKLQKGDTLMVECTYNTMDRETFTIVSTFFIIINKMTLMIFTFYDNRQDWVLIMKW